MAGHKHKHEAVKYNLIKTEKGTHGKRKTERETEKRERKRERRRERERVAREGEHRPNITSSSLYQSVLTKRVSAHTTKHNF